MGWGKDEASSPPTPCRASLPRVPRRGVRSSVSLFSSILGPQGSGGHTAHVALPWAKGALPPLLVCLNLPGNCETEGPWGGGRKPLKNNQEKRAGESCASLPPGTVAFRGCKERQIVEAGLSLPSPAKGLATAQPLPSLLEAASPDLLRGPLALGFGPSPRPCGCPCCASLRCGWLSLIWDSLPGVLPACGQHLRDLWSP